MVPLSARMTSGDPALAQAWAHWALIGFFRSFVNAHAESSTYPFTDTDFPASLPVADSTAKTKTANNAVAVFLMLIFQNLSFRFEFGRTPKWKIRSQAATRCNSKNRLSFRSPARTRSDSRLGCRTQKEPRPRAAF